LAVALAECCITGPDRLGADVALPVAGRVDEALFGEAPSRIVVTAAPTDVERLTRIVGEWAVPVSVLGRVGGDRLEIRLGTGARLSVTTEALADAFENGLARALEQPIETLSAREAPRAEGRPISGGANGGGDQ
jgi:phosphoribosylformylglycinamidine synthase